MACDLQLEIENGELAGRRFEVRVGGMKLGRSSSNDIHVPDIELSRAHCLFSAEGETGLQVTDLASANGTFVNGRNIGSASVSLREGDLIEVGVTKVRVVKPGAPAPKREAEVDLGLAAPGTAPKPMTLQNAKTASPRTSHRALVWGGAAVILALLAGVACVLDGDISLPGLEPGKAPAVSDLSVPAAEASKTLRYEKVKADSESIFRFYLELGNDGVLRVAVDDVPRENRHVRKEKQLSPEKLAILADLLADHDFDRLDREYTGPDAEPPVLDSYDLQIGEHRVSVVNTDEPRVFSQLREKLEAFAMNELGIRALQYSRDKLLALAAECAENGRTKWEDRSVQNGNVYQSFRSYDEAIAYLETVNPKPPVYNDYVAGRRQARQELDRRYADQRFAAERAQKLGDWPLAKTELMKLLELLVDRSDPRYREAQGELVDVEKRIGKEVR